VPDWTKPGSPAADNRAILVRRPCARIRAHGWRTDHRGVAMTTSATMAPLRTATHSISIAGGAGAPERARRHVHSQLASELFGSQASDAALIVSELVTNSVLHANIGPDQALLLELTKVSDHLRIAVIDAGSQLEPRLLTEAPTTPHGFGLRLVDQLSSAWGVVRDAAGTTCVWCDLPLDLDQRGSSAEQGGGS
jgi:serine/threonine-protein kinase RsbW